MTSKKRVLTAFNHEEPDRVPINFVGANTDIDRRLKKHFGLDSNDNEGLLKSLNVDFRQVGVPYVGPKIHKDVPDRHIDPLWGIHSRWIEHASGGYWDFCDFPLKNATVEDIEAWPMPSPDDFDYNASVCHCEKCKEYCVVYGNPGLADFMNSSGMLCGIEKVYMNLALEDEAWLRLIDRKIDIELGVMSRLLEVAKDSIDMIWLGEDLGSQNSPLMSREMFTKVVRPRHQKFIDLAQQYNLPVMIHSCGSSSWAFDDFIEMGIDIVDTLQPEAKGMDPAYLKKNFGDSLSFHGCISTAGPMAYGSVQDVINNVKGTLEVMMPGGGYAMAPTHFIQDNSPTENVVIAYEVAFKYGHYY